MGHEFSIALAGVNCSRVDLIDNLMQIIKIPCLRAQHLTSSEQDGIRTSNHWVTDLTPMTTESCICAPHSLYNLGGLKKLKSCKIGRLLHDNA